MAFYCSDLKASFDTKEQFAFCMGCLKTFMNFDCLLRRSLKDRQKFSKAINIKQKSTLTTIKLRKAMGHQRDKTLLSIIVGCCLMAIATSLFNQSVTQRCHHYSLPLWKIPNQLAKEPWISLKSCEKVCLLFDYVVVMIFSRLSSSKRSASKIQHFWHPFLGH